ncbi:MAG TPA: hypothetical protein VGL05_15285 [Kribbella sp.]
MRTVRGLSALLAVTLTGLGIATALPAAHADPDPNLHITSVTLSRTSVAVSGLNTVPVTVTVKGSYGSGTPEENKAPVNVILERTGGSGQRSTLWSTNLPRLANGTWGGSLYVPSTANGTFRVSGVMTGPYFPNSGRSTTPSPYPGPVLTVTGTHQPKITASVIPKVVPYNTFFSIKWAVTDAQTGKPYGSRVRVVADGSCGNYVGPYYTDLTGTDGLLTRAYNPADAYQPVCLGLPSNPALVAGLGFLVTVKPVISAVPAWTAASVGTVVPVNGIVYRVQPGCKVYVQRLYGATQWRTVSTASVRLSDRYTANVQLASKGNIPYRAYFPPCHSVVALSKTFYIRTT